MVRGTYVSSDELERAEAAQFGYRYVCHHPNEIGVVDDGETLVIDFDHVLFDDQDLAVLKANQAANCGTVVGIHTYYPNDPRLQQLLALPNVLVAKTHRRLLKAMRQHARLKRPPSQKVARRPHSE
ncbi:MAG TPA: hypothetical protein VEL76_02805 [Gemmataceae bacterium]|nr:hypothetical protein [Gemmataceae bacterium]